MDVDGGDIPSGLNRIKTRRDRLSDERLGSGGDDLPALACDRGGAMVSDGGGVSRELAEEKNGRQGGLQKGKKIAKWFTSYLSNKDSTRTSTRIPRSTKVDKSMRESKMLDGQEYPENSHDWKDLNRKHSVPYSNSAKKTVKGQKSFSHELGPRGGIRPVQPRAHSYNDLEELLRSLLSKFDNAKEEVNAELELFTEDVLGIIEKNKKSMEKIKDLLILSQQCREMSSHEFCEKCEGIVQDLAERRQKCDAGLLKQLLTHMLFILTRCTRLLQLQKAGTKINEDSINKFKQCLDSIPAVEFNWVLKHGNINFHLDDAPKHWDVSNHELEKNSKIDDYSAERHDKDSVNSLTSSNRKFVPSHPHGTFFHCNEVEGSISINLQQSNNLDPYHEQKESVEESDFVMCRICEENVPAHHLESHSYICAYADKCDLEGYDVDDRLLNIADVLEQIVESYVQTFPPSYSSPEIMRTQSTSSVIGSNCQSPKVSEWHNKGTEGMFEDLHEMDTACIDEPYLASYNNLKSHLVMKLGVSAVTSSNGSMTPASSTTTPRTCHFDFFWLEYNNNSEQENREQMNMLAEIAHRAASTDPIDKEAPEHLTRYMHALNDVLQHSKLKALVVDTFGSRIGVLLKEKYLLAVEFMDNKSGSKMQSEEGRGYSINSANQHRLPSKSTPLHKERTSINDFEIIKPISKGSFGRVFLARKRTTGDLFAIKVLKKLDMIRKNDVDRILAERKILITVRNPFVVRFFYSFTCRENLYLVMEYLNGGDLYSLLRKVGCLEEDIARIYIAELVLALEYIHSLGIVHRDLKPDNILVARDGHIKLTDFGLSKIGLINSAADLSGTNAAFLFDTHNLPVSPENTHYRKKSQRYAVGTPDYLAPEILLGTEHGYSADWWSVGIILFEFITGIPPFTAQHPEIIFDNILNRRIPWPHVPEDMSYEAKDLIDRLLVQDPYRRLGVNGAFEVKTHSFFQKIDWENLSFQKAAFIPIPDSADDTSYFLSRYSPGSAHNAEGHSSDSASDAADSGSIGSLDFIMDEYEEPREHDESSGNIDLSLMNFSFKNLSQLATMNYDVLVQSGKTSKASSPARSLPL